MDLEAHRLRFDYLTESEPHINFPLKLLLIVFIFLKLFSGISTAESCAHLQAPQQPTYTWKQHAHQEDTSAQEGRRSSLGSYHQALRSRPRRDPLIEAQGVTAR